MRGENETQGHMFTYLSPEQRVPKDHPLRKIKENADQVLKQLSPTFRAMYSRVGRPSIPPERLLKAQILIALYSVRSDRLFCGKLQSKCSSARLESVYDRARSAPTRATTPGSSSVSCAVAALHHTSPRTSRIKAVRPSTVAPLGTRGMPSANGCANAWRRSLAGARALAECAAAGSKAENERNCLPWSWAQRTT